MDIKKIDKKMNDDQFVLDEKITWIDLLSKTEYIQGRCFDNGFSRIRRNYSISENADRLAKCPAGMNIAFKTSSNKIKIKANLIGKAYMPHMTATATIGFDLYLNQNGKYIFLSSTKINQKEYEILLSNQEDNIEREYKLYFPLYQELVKVWIGIEEGKDISFIPKKKEKLVIYGTSISQGGCASRPGMAYGAILERKTKYDVINFGFSGSCKLEKKMALLLNEIEYDKLIIECEANSPSNKHLKENLEIFLNTLDKKRDIYLITHFPEGRILLDKNIYDARMEAKDIQKSFKNIEVIDGEKILEEIGYEGTVDGCHLTDLGFYVLATNLLEYIS